MINKAQGIYDLIRSGLINFRDTDFSQVQYVSLGLALGAGLFIAGILLFKLLWGKNKFRRAYSGHIIPKEDLRGNAVKFAYALPKVLCAIGTLFTIWALANPYLPRTKIEERIESIEWIHLIDVSPSKGWEYENTGKSTGEITHQALLKFLKMRRGQNDRCSLWYFAAAPTMAEDFITDDDIYYMQVEDMPFVVTDPGSSFLPENDTNNSQLDIITPRDRIKMVMNGGGTNLITALDVVISHSDNNGDKNIKEKVLLIETDMAIDADPDQQFRELKKRKINVYILHTKPNEEGETKAGFGAKMLNAQNFERQIRKYGFKFYSVHDPGSLEKAYRDINKLQKSPAKLIRQMLRVFIYQRPLLAGVVFLFVGIGLGLMVERFWGESP